MAGNKAIDHSAHLFSMFHSVVQFPTDVWSDFHAFHEKVGDVLGAMPAQ